MVYHTSENYNLGRSREKLLTKHEYDVNHVSYRYYNVKSRSREGEEDVTFIDNLTAMVELTRIVKY
jgi:hypothetical protein